MKIIISNFCAECHCSTREKLRQRGYGVAGREARKVTASMVAEVERPKNLALKKNREVIFTV